MAFRAGCHQNYMIAQGEEIEIEAVEHVRGAPRLTSLDRRCPASAPGLAQSLVCGWTGLAWHGARNATQRNARTLAAAVAGRNRWKANVLKPLGGNFGKPEAGGDLVRGLRLPPPTLDRSFPVPTHNFRESRGARDCLEGALLSPAQMHGARCFQGTVTSTHKASLAQASHKPIL